MKKKSLFKRLSGVCLAMAMCFSALSVTAEAEDEELTGKTAMEITGMMGKGWDLGNTFDATGGSRSNLYSQETSWGNPQVTKELIDGVKAAGFTTIRIPVTWYKHINRSDYSIDADFMARITEIVDYAYDNDMFVILNVHHEAWVNVADIDTTYVEIGEELKAVWSQIADNFADYDQHLIFEGMNEPRAVGTDYEWTGTQSCYDAVNYLDQVFVETIRSNGKGHNPERAIMIPGYAASNSKTVLQSIKIPEIDGKQAENVIISVHCYSPYNFCLTDNQSTFSSKNSADTSDITTMISNLKLLFINNGIPVVIGECGATNTKDNLEARIEWFKYFGTITAENNIPAIVWDNGNDGNSGGECHNYFNRKTGEEAYPELINAFIYGDPDGNVIRNLSIDFEPYKEGDETVFTTASDLGFSPSKLNKQMKINHTEGAAQGFSLKADSNSDNGKVYLDISKYAGLTVRVTAWVRADEASHISLGIKDTLETVITEADVYGEWSEASFCATLSDEGTEKEVVFSGDPTYYIDDVTVEVIDEAAVTEAYFNVAGEAPETETDTKVEVTAEVSKTSATDEVNETVSQPSGSEDVSEAKAGGMTTGGKIALGGGIAVIIIAGIVAALKRSKKKK